MPANQTGNTSLKGRSRAARADGARVPVTASPSTTLKPLSAPPPPPAHCKRLSSKLPSTAPGPHFR